MSFRVTLNFVLKLKLMPRATFITWTSYRKSTSMFLSDIYKGPSSVSMLCYFFSLAAFIRHTVLCVVCYFLFKRFLSFGFTCLVRFTRRRSVLTVWVRFLLPFHPSVLKPRFYLSLIQAKRLSKLGSV